jgi:hypothetical protein
LEPAATCVQPAAQLESTIICLSEDAQLKPVASCLQSDFSEGNPEPLDDFHQLVTLDSFSLDGTSPNNTSLMILDFDLGNFTLDGKFNSDNATSTTTATTTTTTTTTSSVQRNELSAWIDSFVNLLQNKVSVHLIENFQSEIQRIQRDHHNPIQIQTELCKFMVTVFDEHLHQYFKTHQIMNPHGANDHLSTSTNSSNNSSNFESSSSLSLSSSSSRVSSKTSTYTFKKSSKSSNKKKRRLNVQSNSQSAETATKTTLIDKFKRLQTIQSIASAGCEFVDKDNTDPYSLQIDVISDTMMSRLTGSVWYLIVQSNIITMRWNGTKGSKMIKFDVLINDKSAPLWIKRGENLIPSENLVNNSAQLPCLKYGPSTTTTTSSSTTTTPKRKHQINREISGMLWCYWDEQSPPHLYIYNLHLFLKKDVKIQDRKMYMVEANTFLDGNYEPCTFTFQLLDHQLFVDCSTNEM